MTLLSELLASHTCDFRIAVQEKDGENVRIIIHARGENSDTLDRWVVGDRLLTLDAYNKERFRETMDLLWQRHKEITSSGWTLYRRAAEEMQTLLDRDARLQGSQ